MDENVRHAQQQPEQSSRPSENDTDSAYQQRLFVFIVDILPCVVTTRQHSPKNQQAEPWSVVVKQKYGSKQQPQRQQRDEPQRQQRPQRREHYGGYYFSRSFQREVEEWEQAREDYWHSQLAFHEDYDDRELYYLTGGSAEQLEQSEQIEIEENWQQQRDFALVEQLEQSEQSEQQALLKQVEFHEQMKHSQQQQSSSSSQVLFTAATTQSIEPITTSSFEIVGCLNEPVHTK